MLSIESLKMGIFSTPADCQLKKTNPTIYISNEAATVASNSGHSYLPF